MRAFFRVAALVVRKDLTVEVRSFEVLSTTLFFAVTVVLIFAFGFVKEGVPVDGVAAAILWIALAFSGTLALGRTFERERQADTLRALMLAPADRPALYVGKLAGIAGTPHIAANAAYGIQAIRRKAARLLISTRVRSPIASTIRSAGLSLAVVDPASPAKWFALPAAVELLPASIKRDTP